MEVIKKLFTKHFNERDGEFQYVYLEGTALDNVDPELAKEVRHLLALGDEDKPV